MSLTLDQFDDVIGGANNDEVLELTRRLFEELADRAGAVAEIALTTHTPDRDVVNEAYVYTREATRLVPCLSQDERVNESWYYLDDLSRKLKDVVSSRGEESSGYMWVPRSPAAKRAEERKRQENDRKADALLAGVDLSAEAVLEALELAVREEGGPTRARDIALALCPDATDPDTPGRQQLIARVGMVIRRLEKAGAVRRTRERQGDKKPCLFTIADEDRDAR